MPDMEQRNAQPTCTNCGRKILRRQHGKWVHDDTRSLYCAGVTDEHGTANTNRATPGDEYR